MTVAERSPRLLRPNGLADHTRVFFVNGGPETIRQYDDASGVGATVLRSDETAENRTQTHDIKVVVADDAAVNHARFAESDIVKSIVEKSPNSLTERTPPSISLISGTENVVLSCPPLGALWRTYTSRFSSRLTSGLSRHAPDQREDGRVGPDSQRQREDHNGREAFAVHQRVETQVLNRGKNDMHLAPPWALAVSRALTIIKTSTSYVACASPATTAATLSSI